MSNLQTLMDNLNMIYTEVNTKILPENIRTGVTIFGVTGESSVAKFFSSVTEMNNSTGNIEDDFAIVYGDTYIGTYRYDNNAWTQLGESTQGQLMMNALNDTLSTTEQYEGDGGTDAQIEAVLDDILNVEEE